MAPHCLLVLLILRGQFANIKQSACPEHPWDCGCVKGFAEVLCKPREVPFAHSRSCMPQPAQLRGFGTTGSANPTYLCICTVIETFAGRGESFLVILKQTAMKPGAPAAWLPQAPPAPIARVRTRSEEDRVSG